MLTESKIQTESPINLHYLKKEKGGAIIQDELLIPRHTCPALEHWQRDLCNIATCWQRKWNE